MTAALIDFEEWSQALEIYEYTKCSLAPLHRFWTQWRRNQSFLMRLLNEQGSEGTQVQELLVDFWSAQSFRKLTADDVRAKLYDAWAAAVSLEGRFQHAELEAMQMSHVYAAATLARDLKFSFRKAMDLMGMGIIAPMVKRAVKKRSMRPVFAGPTKEAAAMKDFVLR